MQIKFDWLTHLLPVINMNKWRGKQQTAQYQNPRHLYKCPTMPRRPPYSTAPPAPLRWIQITQQEAGCKHSRLECLWSGSPPPSLMMMVIVALIWRHLHFQLEGLITGKGVFMWRVINWIFIITECAGLQEKISRKLYEQVKKKAPVWSIVSLYIELTGNKCQDWGVWKVKNGLI